MPVTDTGWNVVWSIQIQVGRFTVSVPSGLVVALPCGMRICAYASWARISGVTAFFASAGGRAPVSTQNGELGALISRGVSERDLGRCTHAHQYPFPACSTLKFV